MYVGGERKNPTYNRILDHTEGVSVTWDPDVLTFADVLDVFMQKASLSSACSGSRQYMVGVWFHNEKQAAIAAQKFAEWADRTNMTVRIHHGPVTQAGIYKAEEYHQRWFEKNGGGW